MTLAVLVAAVALFFVVILGGTRMLGGRRDPAAPAWRGFSIAFAFVLLTLAVRVYLGRFERLFADHTIFAGVTYTDAHVDADRHAGRGGALVARRRDRARQRGRGAPASAGWWLAVAPAAVCYVLAGVLGWYVTSFIVKPNELVRETPVHHAQHRDDAAGVRARPHRAACRSPPKPASRRSTPANNQETLENIRLWDWRALQDTLRQIQEIRTYYDFPDIDIDRYEIDGKVRQMMLADARAERRAAAREQPQLDQREADLHARLRRHDEPGQRLHAGRAARR